MSEALDQTWVYPDEGETLSDYPEHYPSLAGKVVSPAERGFQKIWPGFARGFLVLALISYAAFCLFSIARASTPDAPLYGLKLAIEDTCLNLTANPVQHASLALGFATERVQEIVQISYRGEVTPETVLQRLQNQLDVTLQDAAKTHKPDQQHILTEVNDVTEELQTTLTQTKQEAPVTTHAALKAALRSVEHAHLQTEQ